MRDYNFKVKCVDVGINFGTYDKDGIYKVKNGALTTNGGGIFKGTNQRLGFRNIDELNDWSSSKFEEVFDDKGEDKKMSKFKVGDMVRILDGSNIEEYIYGWADEMTNNVNKIAKISSVEEENGLFCYCLDNFDYAKYTRRCIYDERGLELVETPTTFTIITSDSTTTLTDGTHTTTINRYYTDKHNDVVALEEVVKKYKSEMSEINREKEIKDAIDKFIKDNNYDVEVEVKRKVVK